MQLADFTPLGIFEFFERRFLNTGPSYDDSNRIQTNGGERGCAWYSFFTTDNPGPVTERLVDNSFLRNYDPCDMAGRVLSLHHWLMLYSRLGKRGPFYCTSSSDDSVVYIPTYLEPASSVCIEIMCDILEVKYEEHKCIG